MTPFLDMPCSVPGCGQPHVGLLLGRPLDELQPALALVDVQEGRFLSRVLGYCAEHQVSDEAHIQRHYLQCRLEGTSHKLAEMFAFQQGPALMTDAVFLEGRGGCYDQFQGSPQGEFYRQAALEEGFNPQGKVYLSGLAAYPGDPRAWVSGRGDVQRVCEERGWDCQGSVNVKAARFQDLAPPSGAVGDDLVESRLEKELEADPGLLEKPREEVKEAVREMITPHWAGE